MIIQTNDIWTNQKLSSRIKIVKFYKDFEIQMDHPVEASRSDEDNVNKKKVIR